MSNTPISQIKDLLVMLAEYDDLPFQRSQTARIASKVFVKKEDLKCALCGRGIPLVPRVVAAHIVPLEEGGTTDANNLIPLCEGSEHISHAIEKTLIWWESVGSPPLVSFSQGFESATGKRVDILGCHKIFDHGLISKKKIVTIARNKEQWGQHISERIESLGTKITSLDIEFTTPSHNQKRITYAEQYLCSHTQGSSEWFRTICKIISMCRRSANLRLFKKADSYISHIDDFLTDKKGIFSPELLSLYYYEKALTLMARKPNPPLTFSLESLGKSCFWAKKSIKKYYWAVSRLEEIHLKAMMMNTFSKETAMSIERELTKVGKILFNEIDQQDNNLNRWKIYLPYFLAKIQIKSKQPLKAYKNITHARFIRDKFDIRNGWSRPIGIHLVLGESFVLALMGNYDQSLRLLSRYLTIISSGRSQRPEGHKDAALCASWIFQKLGKTDLAGKAKKLAGEICDGRSGIWPIL